MDDLITQRLAQLERTVAHRSRAAAECRLSWMQILEIFEPNSAFSPTVDGGQVLWAALLRTNFVAETLRLLRITIQREDNADHERASMAIGCGAQSLNWCAIAGTRVHSSSEADIHYKGTRQAVKALLDESPALIALWWRRYKRLVPTWLSKQRFNDTCTPFAELLGALYEDHSRCVNICCVEVIISMAPFSAPSIRFRTDFHPPLPATLSWAIQATRSTRSSSAPGLLFCIRRLRQVQRT